MRRCTTFLAVWVFLPMLGTLAAAQPAQQRKAYEELQRKYEAALQDITHLRSELEALKRKYSEPPPPGTAEHTAGDNPLQVGNAHFLAQRYTEAIAAYTTAIESAPRDARAYKYRGLAHAKLGNVQRAHKDLSQAIELEPQDALAYNQRGIASFATGNMPAAVKDFTRAMELQPQLAEAYNNRGILQHKLGDYLQAGKDFARAAQLGMALANDHLQVLRDEIRQAQEDLRKAGLYSGAADGVLAKHTVTALRQYQKLHGLSITGLLDDATRKALRLSPEPAAAPRFTHQSTPEYPEAARQQGWEGTVTLRLELRADGTVGEVQVARSSGHVALDTAAQEAAKTWKHEPATQHGAPATRWVEMHLTFQLDKEQVAGSIKP